MITVPITLRSAIDGRTEVLRTIVISNDGTGTPSRGNYNVKLLSKDGRVIKTARVEYWPRKSKTPQALLAKCLKALEV